MHRAIEMVNLLKAEGPLSLEEVHVILSLSKSTLLRLFSQMEQEGWVYRYLSDDRYCLASHIFAIEEKALAKIEIAKISKSILEELFENTGHPSDLAIKLDDFVIVESSFGKTNYRNASRHVIGITPQKHHSSLWKAYHDQDRHESTHGCYYPRLFNHWEHSFNAKFPYNAIAVPLHINNTTIGAINIAAINEIVHTEVLAERHLQSLISTASLISQALEKHSVSSAIISASHTPPSD
ncbi:helix-turn-helix domain-containing protein [Pseudomonas plecoglossicida]|uniref:helix-turn-helix domain-containing protein n=1 Tax=Pseudomonas plecoglossicida TaxID=70775 RepID=UPI003D228BC1